MKEKLNDPRLMGHLDTMTSGSTAPPSRSDGTRVSDHIMPLCNNSSFLLPLFARIECTKSDIVERNRVDEDNHIRGLPHFE